jgi:glycosyltransferase involved in cell wall biosynthesis
MAKATHGIATSESLKVTPAMPLSFRIVTPTFNQARTIRATIESVLSQDYAHIDYFVQDGGSTDGTIEILESYGSRVKWKSEKDAGQSDAILKGFAGATADVLGWLNSDDTFAPGAVKSAAGFLETHPDVALVYAEADFIDVDGNFIAKSANVEPWSYRRLLKYSDFIIQPASFFRREAFEAVGGIDKSLHYAMDYDLWLKLGKKYPVAYVPELWAHYRWMGGNKSAIGGWPRIEEVREVMKRHGGPELPGYFWLEKTYLHIGEMKARMAEGRTGRAAGEMGRAIASAISPRAIVSLLQPRTWRIIYTGQVLRRAVR